MYVNSKSNHPPAVLKNIPLGVNRRLSRFSAKKEVFAPAASAYLELVAKIGYTHKLTYEATESSCTQKINITWFNPPFQKI